MRKLSEKRYHQLLDNVNDIVYTFNIANNKFTYVNKTGERLLGYSLKELQKLDLSKVIAHESLGLVRQMIAQKLTDGIPTIYEIEIIRKDGMKIPVEINSKVIYERGKPIELLGVARDITERKQLERQREIFISLITHEIKNPLTAVQTYVELLRRKFGKENTESTQYFQTIKYQLRSMNRLMTDFLELSKIQLGKLSIKKSEFDLDKEVKKIIDLFLKDEITITKKGSIGKAIIGDKDRIGQVLVNLISNARKYSDASKVVIHLSSDEQFAKIGIQDFGKGIPEVEQSMLFDLFFRTEAALQKQIQGHGLGLYICREIVKSHGGEIWVESEMGKGSTFYFTLPIGDNNNVG